MKTIRILVLRLVLACQLLVITASLRAADDFGAGIYMGQCENLTAQGRALMRLTVISRKGDNFTGYLKITGELEGTGEVSGTLTKDTADFSLSDKEAGYTIRFKASKRDTAALSGSYEADMPSAPAGFPKKQIGTWRIEQVTQDNLARLKDEEAKLEKQITDSGQLQKRLAELEIIAAAVEAEVKAANEAKRQLAEMKAYVAQHEAELAAEMTKKFTPKILNEILQDKGINGTILDYDVDRVVVEGGDFLFQLRLLWRKPDLSGGAALIVGGWNVSSEESVPDRITFIKDIPAAELAAYDSADKNEKSDGALSTRPSMVPSVASSNGTEQGFYQRNQEVIDKAAIGVGVVLITEWVKSIFEEAQKVQPRAP